VKNILAFTTIYSIDLYNAKLDKSQIERALSKAQKGK
jgi:hypothetical protein